MRWTCSRIDDQLARFHDDATAIAVLTLAREELSAAAAMSAGFQRRLGLMSVVCDRIGDAQVGNSGIGVGIGRDNRFVFIHKFFHRDDSVLVQAASVSVS